MAKPAPVLQEPVKLSRTPLTIRRRASQLGEHTDPILALIGVRRGGHREVARRSPPMNVADCFACLPSLLDGDHDLRRRGRWVNVECRVDRGDEPSFLAITCLAGGA